MSLQEGRAVTVPVCCSQGNNLTSQLLIFLRVDIQEYSQNNFCTEAFEEFVDARDLLVKEINEQYSG